MVNSANGIVPASCWEIFIRKPLEYFKIQIDTVGMSSSTVLFGLYELTTPLFKLNMIKINRFAF